MPINKYIPEFYSTLYGKTNLITHMSEVLTYMHNEERKNPIIDYSLEAQGVDTGDIEEVLFRSWQNFKGTKADLVRVAKGVGGIEIICSGTVSHKDSPTSPKIVIPIEQEQNGEDCQLSLYSFVDLDVFDGGGFAALTPESLAELIERYTLFGTDILKLTDNIREQLTALNNTAPTEAQVTSIATASLQEDGHINRQLFEQLCDTANLVHEGFDYELAESTSQVATINTRALLTAINAVNAKTPIGFTLFESLLAMSKQLDGGYNTELLLSELNRATSEAYVSQGFAGMKEQLHTRMSVCTGIDSVVMSYRSQPMYPFDKIWDELYISYDLVFEDFLDSYEQEVEETGLVYGIPPIYYSERNPETEEKFSYGEENAQILKNFKDYFEYFVESEYVFEDQVTPRYSDALELPEHMTDVFDSLANMSEALEISIEQIYCDSQNVTKNMLDVFTPNNLTFEDGLEVTTTARSYGGSSGVYGADGASPVKRYAENTSVGFKDELE